MKHPKVNTALHEVLSRLEAEHVLEISLEHIDQLFADPDVDPFVERRGPDRAGVDDLAATLQAARRLPEDLTVRILLPPDEVEPDLAERTRVALGRRAGFLASVAWRDAMAGRSGGRRQLPAGILIGVIGGVLAYVSAFLVSTVDNVAVKVLLGFVGFVAIVVAWVAAWVTVEAATLDWRQDGHAAAAYEVLAGARVEVVADPARPPGNCPNTNA